MGEVGADTGRTVIKVLSQCLMRRKRESWEYTTVAPQAHLPVNPRGPLRGIQQGPVQKRGVVVILEVVPLLTQHGAVGGFVVGGDADGV